jgi:hypothetical protein
LAKAGCPWPRCFFELAQVEFLPIELEARAEDQGAALFAANYNQFYFK